MNRLYSFLRPCCLLLLSMTVLSPAVQGEVIISGNVTDKRGTPVEYVTVIAVKKTGSTGTWTTHTDENGHFELGVQTPVYDTDPQLPEEFSLSQNYPNPFNPSTRFEYSLQKPVSVKIDLFDVRGRFVRTLVDERKQAGTYYVDWDGLDHDGNSTAAGIYIARMRAGDMSTIKKCIKNDGGYIPSGSAGRSVVLNSTGFMNKMQDTDLFDLTFRKESVIAEYSIVDFTVGEHDTTIDVTVNRTPVYITFDEVHTYPNHTVLFDNNGNIYDPDDNLEDLVISCPDSTFAEITGLNENSQVQVKLIKNKKGFILPPISVSDGHSAAIGDIPMHIQGKTAITKVIDWETGDPIQTPMHFIAINQDTTDTTFYDAFGNDNGVLTVTVKPGKYDLFIRDELEHFDIEPIGLSDSTRIHSDFPYISTLLAQKKEWLKIGNWYDRTLEDIEIYDLVNLPDQLMIREDIDLTDPESCVANYSTIPSRFDYAAFFWITAGYKYWYWGNQGIKPDGYSYRNTGQGITELKKSVGGRWKNLVNGDKIFINNTTVGSLGTGTIAPYKGESNNQHAIETYLQAEREFFTELNPDWFEFGEDMGAGYSFFEIRYKPDTWLVDDETVYQGEGSDFVVKKMFLNNQITGNYTYSQADEAKAEIKQNLMSKIMEVMGIDGLFWEWMNYGNGNYQARRATSRKIASEWDPRDIRAIRYYYKTNDLDPTHVLID